MKEHNKMKKSIDELAKEIAKSHTKRTGSKNQLGSVEKVVKELLPDILEVLDKTPDEYLPDISSRESISINLGDRDDCGL